MDFPSERTEIFGYLELVYIVIKCLSKSCEFLIYISIWKRIFSGIKKNFISRFDASEGSLFPMTDLHNTFGFSSQDMIFRNRGNPIFHESILYMKKPAPWSAGIYYKLFRITSSISSAISGFSLRKFFAFSLPCPRRVSP